MKPIPTEKKADGGVNVLIGHWNYDPETVVALYERTGNNPAAHHWGYEVVVLRRRLKEERLPDGRIIEPGGWKYPSASQFGRLAWSIASLIEARLLAAALVAKTKDQTWAEIVSRTRTQGPLTPSEGQHTGPAARTPHRKAHE